jgi:hypothetical protein
MDVLKPLTASEGLYNGRVKIYPDGGASKLVCDRPVFNPHGLEVRKRAEPCGAPSVDDDADAKRAANVERAQRRARGSIRDLLRCNPDLGVFVTLTLNRAMIDRYDYGTVIRRLSAYLDNRVRRDALAYVMVPEHHKDGAIHFHGLFRDVLSLVDSGRKTEAGQVIYNMPSWALGFTTAIKVVGDRGAVMGYVAKYITKSSVKVGGRWYLSGGSLARPECHYFNADFSEDGGKVLDVSAPFAFKVEDF